jgi:DNA-binding transcriptional MerR regulator
MTTDQTLNISEAARATGKSVMTIRAYLEAKPSKLPNAFQTPKGKSKSWNIPLTDLVAAGLLDSVTSEPQTSVAKQDPADLELRVLVATLEAENNSLRERLAETKEALARAERRVDQLLPIRELETAQVQKARRSFFSRKPKDTFETMPTEHLSE